MPHRNREVEHRPERCRCVGNGDRQEVQMEHQDDDGEHAVAERDDAIGVTRASLRAIAPTPEQLCSSVLDMFPDATARPVTRCG